MKSPSTKKNTLLMAIGIPVAVLLVIYVGLMVFFSSHYWFNTTINGVDVSGKTVEEVKARITQEVDTYKISVSEDRIGEVEDISGSQIDLKPVFGGELEQALIEQNAFAWPVSLFQKTNVDEQTVSFDEAKLLDAVGDLASFDEAKIIPPEDAYISEYRSGSGFVVIPEVEGNEVIQGKLEADLMNAIVGLHEAFSIEEDGAYLAPEIRVDNETLNTQVEKLNQYANAKITYEFGNDTEVLDGSTISQWLVIGEGTDVSVDEDLVAAYVKDLAADHDTAGKSKSLRSSWGSTVTVPAGSYGWKIDRTEEKVQLLADLEEGKSVSREPIFKQRAASFGSNDFGDTYVEVNLSAQKMYYYQNGNLVVSSDFVSGNIAKNTITHTGAYSIAYTQKDAVLRGADYETPVSYWMPFNNGEGLHDATWRNTFGGSIYQTNGSHGCVNLPKSAAKTLFENIKSGTPVLVYYLPGTEPVKPAEAPPIAPGEGLEPGEQPMEQPQPSEQPSEQPTVEEQAPPLVEGVLVATE